MVNTLKNYINGSWIESKAKEEIDVFNPATKELIAKVPVSTREELDYAAEVAQQSFEQWKEVPVPKRARILFKFQQLLIENKNTLAEIITKENGKNLTEALGEVQRGIENVEFACGAPSLMMGDSLSSIATNIEGTNYRYPIGVIGGITPFNFPMMVPCWMFPMAIAMGNTFIIKPSEKTPLLVNKLVDLLEEAGLPKGVFNVVHGAHDVVNGICENEHIKGVSFVGSKPVGAYVYKKATDNLKRAQCLTGAKNHTIVLNDANLDQAVKDIIGAAFGSAGERCMAAAVVAVEEGVYDTFKEKLVQASKEIVIGNGLEDNVFLGPVIREENKERTIDYVNKGIEEGADLVLDGREDNLEEGYFVKPTIFENVTTDMKLWQDEIFAPVLSLVKVSGLKEGVQLANKSEFANGACLFTDSASAVRYFRETIDAGMLGINLGVPAPMAIFPFSGWKSSFYGSLHCNGKDSIEFYTHRKVVTARHDTSKF
ncbi:CoA-acylating methylmalonate-semialdehyde dehydrogenase [Staphylococcus kloosii]|jgi:malonate-semialdehyde dehydrogenase (acetylating)/methylmalonate-semialdehyde dehydrogenase|uniref:methylmalonate-semialdehyde dehydrogenase (CoA acylating) n=2 Tax=Staphylococcus kloosii TaxID=29384 RepID=A0ABQ0XRC6_9STAP|nr:CoA-acylating methylmalonate-semialdehyde dehydrogenase [Staphylococcus kloosii]AVQ34818.1 methylmalonate-semialdehyde dehydrogenase (CoA acylating) [Staphylococcus kloosii]MBF7029961.1 CoA-acylating methylmalonate-semialdehyde dehydrogenase [Staphylococcus kloosii]PNZ06608.1 methylmalonate-semialdehyde dehydrogenase (CoA acylating) [Staphylococcus kloosii]SUM50380.1 putative aldehyde dehydrogenase family protein [Staphylococcus kloosii]GEP81895.1 methylmalonate semialdehyde dehydrogenase [